MVEFGATGILYSCDEGRLFERDVSALVPLDSTQYPRGVFVLVSVRHRPHQLSISFSHHEPALLDEAYPIVVEITNTDDRALDVVVDVLLQPTEVDEAGAFPFLFTLAVR